MALTGSQRFLPFRGRNRFWWEFASELEGIVSVGIPTLTVPSPPTVAAPIVSKIEETPVSQEIALSVPEVPTVVVSTQVT